MEYLLRALLEKDAFGKYGELTRGQLKTDETKEIYRAIEILHEETDEDLTVEGLTLSLNKFYPAKKADALAMAISHWGPVDPALVESYFVDAVRKARAFTLAEVAIQVFEGRKPYEDLTALFTDEAEVNPEYEFVSNNLTTLQERQVATGGFKWRLRALNELLGHLPRKRFGFIYARPETGKTLLLGSEVTNFALQTDEPIFWLANEEDPDTVMIRCYCGLFGINEARLFANLDKYQAEYNKRIGDRLIITGDPHLNNKLALQREFKRLKPAIVVIDQLDNVSGFKADREDLRCGALYRWFRAQSIAHNFTAIGVTQAGGSAEGEKWLKMNQVAESHTTKAATADWMLGIGKERDNDLDRFLHTPKDKLPLSEGKDPAKRHGYATVGVNLETNRYEDFA